MTNQTLTNIYYKTPPALQNVLISAYRYARKPFEYGHDFRRWRSLLDESQNWSLAELENWQLERLQALLQYVYADVPGYRQLYRDVNITPRDIRSLEDMWKLPIVSKQHIRENRALFTSSSAKSFKPVELNTSGTTGTPFQFLSTRETEAIEWAFNWRHKSWGGARLWEPMFSLGGKIIVPLSQQNPPFWRTNRAENMIWLSAFHMTQQNLDLYVDYISKANVRFIKGYPSNLSILAHHLRGRNARLPMKAVFTGSEPLLAHARELIEDRFCCKVFDWYGVSERVVTASQCSVHNNYHVHMENCVVEVVQKDSVVSKGTLGEIVGTCLSNYAMPLIRYRTGDLSSLSSEPCPCGRGLMTISQVQTKWEHLLFTEDGRWISPSVLTHPFKPVKGVRRSQIIQESLGELRIKVVGEPDFGTQQQALLIDGFKERLGESVKITIDMVDDIPNDPSGKFRWVISKVPMEANRMLDHTFGSGIQ